MKKQILQLTVKSALIACAVLMIQCDVCAQKLTREVREKFESMVDDLSPALQKKFQKALDNNTSVVEMSPAEFRSFKRNPANPFDINDVDPDDLDGNIELRFELPSLRNRPVRKFERQSRSLRRNLRSVVTQAASSTVKITDGFDQIALGTIVREDGMILTKLSEVEKADKLYVIRGAQRSFDTKIIQQDTTNDLALLKIQATGLPVVNWSNSQPLGGAFLVSPNQMGEVVSVGTFSVVTRSTVGENRGFLGVAPAAVENGVKIQLDVESNTAAYAAGLRMGDVIMSINGTAITQVDQLVYEISSRQAGDEIQIVYSRNDRQRSTTAKLSGINLTSERAARFKMMSRLGAIPSDRKSEFPVVFQHDSPLFPEQCGGPICDLSGNVLGINIARESRASSFAIPTAHVKKTLDQWFRYDVASREAGSH